MSLYDALTELELTPRHKALCAQAVYDFVALSSYLQSCSTPTDALYVLKYLLDNNFKHYMITRVYGRYKKLRTAQDYKEIYTYAQDKGASDRSISKLKS